MRVEKRISNRLRDYKASSGFTNKQLADDLGVSERTLYRYLRGDIKDPSSKFTKNFKRRLYRRWKGSDKSLRSAGAVVDLSEYFRRVWFDNGVLNDPIYLRTIPRYSFPQNAPVTVLVKMNVQLIEDGVEIEESFAFQIMLIEPVDTLAELVNTQFLEWYAKTVTSRLQITKIEREGVLLRWGKNRRR